MGDTDYRLRRINIPSPNAGLAEWLLGPHCKAAVTEVTAEIYAAYVNSLPVGKPEDGDTHPGRLKASAGYEVVAGAANLGGKNDRYYGYVFNTAVGGDGYFYGRAVEYGNGRMRGQHQLRDAAHLVAGNIGTADGVNIPGVTRDSSGRLRNAKGQFVRNPLNKRSGTSTRKD